MDIALSSAKRSASSAEPPRSPLNVLAKLDLMPRFSSTGSADPSPSGIVVFGKKALSSSTSSLASEGAGGTAMTTSKSLSAAAFFLAPLRFHGGNGRADFSALLSVDLMEFGATTSSFLVNETLPSFFPERDSISLLASPSKRLVDPFMDIARNSASKSASSALPPRSPLNVLGRLDLMPMCSSCGVNGVELSASSLATPLSFSTASSSVAF
mmetsp:Transcript_12264/g.26669  ORF Transcript_12264/g.26669 Transcript_12264/m.26669 type:complete len:212 (-) Transcript_12264:51-686(-)